MSMTLEEAIEHAEKVAEENEKISLYTPVEFIPGDLSIEQCQKCADDHRQLAAWLRELKERREQPEITRCKDCKEFRRWIDTDIEFCDRTENRVSEDDFCSRAERRNE